MIPKSKRIEHYRKLIEKEKHSNFDSAICISLGEIAYGHLIKCPWACWEELIEYYPELKRYKGPKYTYGSFSKAKRKKVILSLQARINKKKDIYY